LTLNLLLIEQRKKKKKKEKKWLGGFFPGQKLPAGCAAPGFLAIYCN
jgi:hypothetical protein